MGTDNLEEFLQYIWIKEQVRKSIGEEYGTNNNERKGQNDT